MKTNIKYNCSRLFLAFALIIALVIGGCSERDLDELEPATFPTNGDVFLDGFSAGLEYTAFGDSKVTAFQVDQNVKYLGEASMRFDVPDADDPKGPYAGGVFGDPVGRDFSGFNALTFWIKATQAANIDELAFGLGGSHQVTLLGLAVNTTWQKVIIPLPDPSKLSREFAFLSYAESPENGKGYSFWIDEAKFEKLGTIAHPQPGILDGQDQEISAETGDKLNIGGLHAEFNMPTGVDQRYELAPAYFSFSSSNPSVATVNGQGQVSVLDSGRAVVTATIGELVAAGSLTVLSTGEAILPPVSAPVPTVDPDSVISMFSNAYNDVPVDTWNPFWEFSTTEVADVQIGDDDLKRYKMLNFVGILTESEKIDASEMTHFHLDIWTPDPTDNPATFNVLLVDFGADGNFGGGDDSSHELTFRAPTLSTESWVSLDIPLSDFAGLTSRTQIAQLVLSASPEINTVFVDNVYYYNAGEVEGAEPTEAAPTPTVDAANVISLYSNAYDNVPVDTWSAVWDQAEVADVQVAGDDAKLYTGLAFAGIEFTSQTVDASQMENFHLDVWTPNPSPSLRIKLVDFGADGAFGGGDDVEHEILLDESTTPALASGSWVGIDVPLSAFAGLTTKGNLAQLIISGDLSPSTLYVDNVYFYSGEGGGGATEPVMAAPTPSQNAADVISLFSDAYTDVPVDTWRTDWSAATFEDVTVDGNATKKYSMLDFVGIETVNNTVDATGMTHFRMDVWSSNFTFFGIKLVDFGADGAFGGGDDVEHQINYEAPQKGGWISYDIPLSDFTGLTTRGHIAQYILVGQPTGATTIYVDNVYFYNENGSGGGGATEPVMAAPTPTRDATNVISLFSDAYDDVPVNTWRTDWSAANFEDVMVDGNPTKKYSALDFAGIETTMDNTLDISGMTHLHIDVWSPDIELFGINLVDFGTDNNFGGGDDVNHQVEFQTPAQGSWISYDIPLSDFTGLVTKENMAQYILVGRPAGASTIFVDNIYFYNENGGGGGGGSTEPLIAAPTPSEDAANVISLFSDAYTDVAVDTWRTDWSSATFEDVMVDGNPTKKYSALDFVGIETVNSGTVDASEMTHFHIDVWSADFTFFGIKLVDFGADGAFGGGDDVEHQINFEAPQQGGWISYDIPLSDFTGLTTRGNIAQYILVGQPVGGNTIYVDNMYFHK